MGFGQQSKPNEFNSLGGIGPSRLNCCKPLGGDTEGFRALECRTIGSTYIPALLQVYCKRELTMAKKVEFNPESAELSGFRKELKSLGLAIGSVQKRIHMVSLAAMRQWLVHENPDWIIELIVAIRAYQGLGAVATWFKVLGGCNVTIDKDGSVRAKKNKDFDWDQDKVAIFSKAKELPFFKLTDAEKPLKLQDELKATAFVVTAARGLEAGKYSEDDVRKVIESLQNMIDKKRADPDIKKWVQTYQAQIASVAAH